MVPVLHMMYTVHTMCVHMHNETRIDDLLKKNIGVHSFQLDRQSISISNQTKGS